MSFSPENINPRISLANYEEFFILYMDNELNPEQVQMVEDFLQLHPELRAELDLIMETKLPTEEFSVDKNFLYASNFKAIAAEEDLLLYIDHEISSEQQKIVELELNSNPAYKQKHELLLKTKLDTSEVLFYPNKKELYRYERGGMRTIPWMRIAAAVLLVAALSVLYFSNENINAGSTPSLANQSRPVKIINDKPVDEQLVSIDEKNVVNDYKPEDNDRMIATSEISKVNEVKIIPVSRTTDLSDIAKIETAEIEHAPENYTTQHTRTASIDIQQQSFNRALVTEPKVDPYKQITAAVQSAVFMTDAASNNETKKGSLKGFMRRASRFVEKTTGLDPTNEDEELLIGVVALKLK
jgi:hypothetical protein